MRSSRSVARRIVLVRANASHARAKRDEARAAAVAVGGEHRADAAAAVGVGADDDRVGADPLEHRLAGPGRQAVDCGSQPADRVARLPHGRIVGRRARRGGKLRKEPCMKLGVHIGYWGLGLTAQEQLELVLEAERLGYDSVWTAEAYGSDAATILGWLAGRPSGSSSARRSSRCPAAAPR